MAWTFWGSAPDGNREDWILARAGRILLFDSAEALVGFVSDGSADHCFSALPGWTSLAREHFSEGVAEFDFDEDGAWLLDPPTLWNGARRVEVLDRLNLFWDVANQFDEKAQVAELCGGGRGLLLGRLADALMESDEVTLAGMAPSDVRAAYLAQARSLFNRCEWVSH